MASTIKGITVEIDGNVQPLNKRLKEVTDTARKLDSELRVIDRLLKLDPSNTTLLAQKQKLLADSIANTKIKLKELTTAQEQAKAQLERGEIGADQYRALEREVIRAQNSLKYFESQAQQVDEALEQTENESKQAGEAFDEMGDAAQKSEKDMKSLSVGGVALGTVLGNVATKLLELAGNAATFLTDAVEETKEFRSDLSKLEQNAKAAGTGIDDVTDDLEYFVAITDETDSSVEALSNLLKAGFTGETLTDAVNNLSGAVVAFPDTLKIESLADSLQETLATGEATGQYGELLERLGVNLEDFNKGLQKCTTSAEKQQYAVDILAKNGMADLNAQYKEANADLIAYSTAQTRYTEMLSKVGAAMQPVMTALTDTKTLLLEGMIPALETAGQALSEKLASPSVQNSFKKLGEGLAEVASAFANFAVFIIENGDTIVKTIISIGVGIAAWKITNIVININKMTKELGSLKKAFQQAIPSIKKMGDAIKASTSATIIGAIATIVMIVAQIAESFLGASDATEDFKSDMASLKEEAEGMATEFAAAQETIAINGETMRGLVTDIQALDSSIKSGNLSAAEMAVAQGQLAAKTAEYNAAAGEEVLKIDAATGAIDGSTSALADNTEALIENARKAAEIEALQKAFEAQTEAQAQQVTKLEEINKYYDQLSDEQKKYIDQMKEEGVSVEALSNLWYASPIWGGQVNNEIRGIVEGLEDSIDAEKAAGEQAEYYTEKVGESAIAETKRKDAIEETSASIGKLGDEEAKRLIWMEESGEKMSELEQQQLDDLKASEDGRYQTLSEAVQKEKELYDERVKNLSYAFQNIRDEMNEASITSIEDMTNNLNAYQDAMDNWYINQQVLAENGLGAFIQVFEDMGPTGYAQAQYVVDQIKNGAEDQLPALKAALSRVIGESENELTNWDSAMLFSGGSGAVQDVADGEASSLAAQNEAKNQIEDTMGSMRDIIISNESFYYLGIGIINRLASGMRDMAWKLYDVADNVVSTLKSKFNFEISVSGTGSGAKFQSFATGGIISREQIVRVAERGPEAIIPLDRLGGIIQGVLDNNGGGNGGNTYQLNVYTSDLSDGAQVRLFKNFSKWAGRRLI